MTILAIETATEVCGAALVRKGAVIGEASINAPHIHSEKLIGLVDESLGRAAVDLGNIDGIAVSIGPGSFTGLRIGLSVAKGLAFASGKPVVPVPTLKALASHAGRESLAGSPSLVLAMIDAGRGDLYLAAYRDTRGTLQEVAQPRVAAPEEVVALFGDERRIVIMGDGADKFQPWLTAAHPALSLRFLFPPRASRLCSAAAVGLIGEEELAAGRAADLATLEPVYGKDFRTLVREHHPEVHS
ncbi:MAG: tRNA (adenosine(37)-N6)-threonylcarbamoyltransferase complex dimerization subunit type 1 TsaB [Ignavibacteria bacterium 13_1_40CM_2_61_4]|nr:MAG: tRNA (adenosine(37)-N6)-threonylcarbamoyltransferase complex dimerization subunit type 1 TsaB [Ignavibacteria bacterium 13_1_40CM_2_61_4]